MATMSIISCYDHWIKQVQFVTTHALYWTGPPSNALSNTIHST